MNTDPTRLYTLTPADRQTVASRQADMARFYRDRGSISAALLYQESSAQAYKHARQLAGIQE